MQSTGAAIEAMVTVGNKMMNRRDKRKDRAREPLEKRPIRKDQELETCLNESVDMMLESNRVAGDGSKPEDMALPLGLKIELVRSRLAAQGRLCAKAEMILDAMMVEAMMLEMDDAEQLTDSIMEGGRRKAPPGEV